METGTSTADTASLMTLHCGMGKMSELQVHKSRHRWYPENRDISNIFSKSNSSRSNSIIIRLGIIVCVHKSISRKQINTVCAFNCS